MSDDTDRQARLAQVARIATALEAPRCPTALLIAQWAIESQWGEKPVGDANYFGIKTRRPPHPVVHDHHAGGLHSGAIGGVEPPTPEESRSRCR
jgi:uncharacterized FlgJ-related protein